MANSIISCIFALLAVLPPGQAEFKTNQAYVHVDIQSSIYTYTITNTGSSDITGFELPQHACYNFKAPDGWELESESGIFLAWAKNGQSAISPQKNGQFSMRVSSSGAVLGKKPVKLKLNSGQIVTVADVWAPAKEPRSYMVLVVGMILLVLTGHTVISRP